MLQKAAASQRQQKGMIIRGIHVKPDFTGYRWKNM